MRAHARAHTHGYVYVYIGLVELRQVAAASKAKAFLKTGYSFQRPSVFTLLPAILFKNWLCVPTILCATLLCVNYITALRSEERRAVM